MRPKKTLLLAALLLLPLVSKTQEALLLKGRVTSKGNGVPYATLQLKGTSIGSSCNDAGEYELRLPSGHELDTVIIRSMGYVGRKITVARLQRNSDVRMESQAIELKTVNVTSYRSGRHLLNDVVKHIGQNY